MAIENREITQEKMEKFLEELAETGNISRSAEAAGINRAYAYSLYDDNPEFARRWDRAVRIGAGLLEEEARRRAYEGVEEYVYSYGKVAGEWRDADGKPCKEKTPGAVFHPYKLKKYSDTLLIVLLKAHYPEKYGTDRLDMTSKGKGLGQGIDLSKLTDDELAQLAALADKAANSGGTV